MVPKVAEPALPPSVTALVKAVQAMARRQGAPPEWTPNTLVEQRVHHNGNKAQQTGRQITPNAAGQKRQPPTRQPVADALHPSGPQRKLKRHRGTAHPQSADTNLQHTVPTSNALVTYRTTQQSTYDYARTVRAQPTQYIPRPSRTTCLAPDGINTPHGTKSFTANAYPDKAGPKPQETALRVTEPRPPTS